jgi:hypothetical protein
MKVQNRLRLIADKGPEVMGLAVQDTADFMLNMIRIYAPVDTGWLRDSYQKESVGLLTVLVGTMVNYSLAQEFGTGNMSGTAHFIPALVQAESFFALSVARRFENLG